MAVYEGEKTSMGRKIVIPGYPYSVHRSEGWAIQITLPNGKLCYTGVCSIKQDRAEKAGFVCKHVHYYGARSPVGVLSDSQFLRYIQIDEKPMKDLVDQLATNEEIERYLKCDTKIVYVDKTFRGSMGHNLRF